MGVCGEGTRQEAGEGGRVWKLRLQGHTDGVQSLALLLSSCVALGKWLGLSGLSAETSGWPTGRAQ